MLMVLAGLDPQRTDSLIQYILVIASDQDDLRDRELGVIHFLKYAYLADLAYSQRHEGQSFTGADWQFYHFGPWQAEIHDRVEPALLAVGATKKTIASSRYEGDFVRFVLERDVERGRLRDRLENALPLGICSTLQRAIHDFGSNTAALLAHVYATEPMVSAAPGEVLRLPSVRRTNEPPRGETQALTDSRKRERAESLASLKQRVQARLTERHRVKSSRISPSPRYDEVFVAGTEWLDTLAGDPIEETAGELTISSDIWKSPTRVDPDVS